MSGHPDYPAEFVQRASRWIASQIGLNAETLAGLTIEVRDRRGRRPGVSAKYNHWTRHVLLCLPSISYPQSTAHNAEERKSGMDVLDETELFVSLLSHELEHARCCAVAKNKSECRVLNSEPRVRAVHWQVLLEFRRNRVEGLDAWRGCTKIGQQMLLDFGPDRRDCTKIGQQVHRGDCLDLLAQLPDGGIHLAFASPPAGGGGGDYLEWSKRWMAEVVRVLRPDGSFWLAIGDEYAAELKVIATRELGLTCRSWVVWYYTSHSHLFQLLVNPKKYTFNAAAIRVPSARELVYKDKRASSAGRLPDDTWILRPQEDQIPEQLLGRIIRASSNRDDTVLDPFAGGGTTLAVAKKLGRAFVGIELSAERADKIEERLAGVQVGDPLSGAPELLKGVPHSASCSPQETPPVAQCDQSPEQSVSHRD